MTSPVPEPAPARPGAALTVAIFSDVHGDLAALRAVLAAIDRLGPVQLTVAAGDEARALAASGITRD